MSRPTPRQSEVLDYLSKHAAFSSEKARAVLGFDTSIADKLVALARVNKRYEAKKGSVYWIRGEGEPATGLSTRMGVLVLLHKDLTTPSGRKENFFLARAPYDGKRGTFRRLLRGWMAVLGLQAKDIVGGSMGLDPIDPDSDIFTEDHVILDGEGAQ